MNRRTAIASAAAVAVSNRAQAETRSDVQVLSELSTRAYAALVKGDAATFAQTLIHAKDFTLMQPMGGPVSHGLDMSPSHIEELGSFFKNGNFRQEVVQSIASEDVIVLVTIEHQQIEVGGLPLQEWPLRVTLVFRRDGKDWQLAHRHADPLVHGITVEVAAKLARGESEKAQQ
jgi:ketosteroid isomerase-like protein